MNCDSLVHTKNRDEVMSQKSEIALQVTYGCVTEIIALLVLYIVYYKCILDTIM